MSYAEIIIIAVGLSMDVFAVSITLGIAVKKSKIIEYLIPGLYFGFFQAVMLLIGYLGGALFAEKVQNYGQWITFALLSIIGGKMVMEALSKGGGDKKADMKKFLSGNMLLLATVTSIDALVVGVTLAFFPVNIYAAIVVTGLAAYIISTAGMKVGNTIGEKSKSKAELFGGVILIALGLKILIVGS